VLIDYFDSKSIGYRGQHPVGIYGVRFDPCPGQYVT
jgi:hypothetical protein